MVHCKPYILYAKHLQVSTLKLFEDLFDSSDIYLFWALDFGKKSSRNWANTWSTDCVCICCFFTSCNNITLFVTVWRFYLFFFFLVFQHFVLFDILDCFFFNGFRSDISSSVKIKWIKEYFNTKSNFNPLYSLRGPVLIRTTSIKFDVFININVIVTIS